VAKNSLQPRVVITLPKGMEQPEESFSAARQIDPGTQAGGCIGSRKWKVAAPKKVVPAWSGGPHGNGSYSVIAPSCAEPFTDDETKARTLTRLGLDRRLEDGSLQRFRH
jgi:hypothetical protein